MIVEKDFLFWSFQFFQMDGPHKCELCVLINLHCGPCIENNLSPCSILECDQLNNILVSNELAYSPTAQHGRQLF